MNRLTAIVALTLGWATVPLSAFADASPQLDYTKVIRQDGMVLIPYVASQHALLYFTDFQQVAGDTIAPQGNSPLSEILINLNPTAISSGKYDALIASKKVIDDRAAVDSSACKPSAEISSLYGSQGSFAPTILPGGYPTACTLQVYFPPDDESKVRDLISKGPVITLRSSTPMCSPTSPAVQVPAIVRDLESAGILNDTHSIALSGAYLDLVYGSVVLAQKHPEYFVTPDPKAGWKVFMGLLNADVGRDLVQILQVDAQVPRTICDPIAPIDSHFG